MDKTKKAILALLKTHQPMLANNLVKIVENETGTPSEVRRAYAELVNSGKITIHKNEMVIITR